MLAFIALSVLGITALNGVSAVETRFNVVPIAIFSVIALARLPYFRCYDLPFSMFAVYGFAGVVMILVTGSYAMDRLASSVLAGRSYDYGIRRCLMTGDSAVRNWDEIIREHEAWLQKRREEANAQVAQ